MPIPILIGAGIIGTGIGYKLGRYIFGEDVEPSISNISNTYRLQLKLLEYSLSDAFLDKKIYAYYLYSLIISQQELLIKLEKDITSNTYIKYYKGTSEEWEQIITEIAADVNDTLKRYLCYETFFKDIFGIDYSEKNLDIIREKILPFEYLSEKQANDLALYIINPLFKGWFDFTAENINVLKCSKINILNSEKNICSSIIISKFPIPELAKPDQKEYIDHNEAPFDSIRPWVLANLIISKKTLSKDYLDSFSGAIDTTLEQFTGVKGNYTIKTGNAAEKLAGSAADWYDQMKKEFDTLRKSLNEAYSSTTSNIGDFFETLKIGAVIGGALLAFKLISGENNE